LTRDGSHIVLTEADLAAPAGGLRRRMVGCALLCAMVAGTLTGAIAAPAQIASEVAALAVASAGSYVGARWVWRIGGRSTPLWADGISLAAAACTYAVAALTPVLLERADSPLSVLAQSPWHWLGWGLAGLAGAAAGAAGATERLQAAPRQRRAPHIRIAPGDPALGAAPPRPASGGGQYVLVVPVPVPVAGGPPVVPSHEPEEVEHYCPIYEGHRLSATEECPKCGAVHPPIVCSRCGACYSREGMETVGWICPKCRRAVPQPA